MKKCLILCLSLILVSAFFGCAKGVESCPAAESAPKSDEPAGEETSEIMISSDMLGQGVYEMLQKDWDAWNAKDEFQRAISSVFPGHCYAGFDTWEECEEFLGFSISNPLESCTWLEKGTYVGMPEGYNEAPRFYVTCYGDSEGQVGWLHVESGYRNGEIRIMVNAQIMIDVPKEAKDDKEPLITEDSGERYVASEALLAKGPVTYSIRVIGEPDMQTQVKETLEEVLVYFKEDPEK